MKYRLTAAVLALLGLLSLIPGVFAAAAMDESKTCTITVVTGNADTAFQEDLNTIASIPVRFYKIADLSTQGTFSARQEFESLKLDKIDPNTDMDWPKKAEEAWEIIDLDEEEKEEKPASEIQPAYTGTILQGKFEPVTVTRGLYLVCIDPVESARYAYRFSPYLISVPDNLHRHAGSTVGEDEWIYDVQVGVKPQRENRLGSLLIEKDLTNFQQFLGETTCIFKVNATMKNPITEQEETVFSAVRALTFRDETEQHVLVEGIPIGATVTVKEVYGGSSYHVVGQDTFVLELKKQEAEETEGTEETEDAPTAKVRFRNENDGKIIPGYGVTNRFENDKNSGWKWTTPDKTEG